MRSKNKKPVLLDMTDLTEEESLMLDELADTQIEFGKLLSQNWEDITKQPRIHAKVVRTAKKISEMKVLLRSRGILRQSIH